MVCESVTDCGNAFADDAVIRGHDDNRLLLHIVFDFTGDAGKLYGNVLQSAERAGRLGENFLPHACGLHGAFA